MLTKLRNFKMTDADHAHLPKLPANQRKAILELDTAGGSYQMVADALQLNIGTVKSRIHRARSALLQMRGAA